jgi:2-succinyl-5-enolpyruvyl-6-hydroxy-3-cyclohexene-1-carboxylate synthase
VPPHLASAPNVNHLWAALLVEELVRQGTTFFVVCPGSRSTPLAVAVAQNPKAEALVHWDERAAGFVALGWGRATGRPAAVVTTSGTAVANLLPAAVEADADGVPLLLLTADRPPELRETGANQTIRQPPTFRDVVRWALDWPVPTSAVPARWVLSTAAHAVHRARLGRGPVHLNLPFREPLAAAPDATNVAAYLADVEGWTGAAEPSARLPVSTVLDASPLRSGSWEAGRWWERAAAPSGGMRGLVLLGPGAWSDATLASAAHVAEAYGWPLVVDVLAGVDPEADVAGVVVRYADLVLASPEARARLRPDAVLHLGGRPTSKRLLALLADARPELYLRITPSLSRQDPDALATHVVVGGPEVLLGLVEPDGNPLADAAWLGQWRQASKVAMEAVGAAVAEGLSEPAVAARVAEADVRAVVAAASMPIRDLEAYRPPSLLFDVPREMPPEAVLGATSWVGPAPKTLANRGASGIDGTVATAHGVARGLGAPVIALVGDLALLHDQTSLALLRDGPPVIVVCVNNDGGGIFHRLPIASGAGQIDGDAFERFFGTPHGLTFEHAAAQVGLAYHAPETREAFDAALDGARQSGASALIEVRTDRHEQAALRRRIEAACADAVDAALAESDA